MAEAWKREEQQPIPDPALEERVAVLEKGLLNLGASNRQVTQALQYVLEHLRNLVPLPERTKQVQRDLDNLRLITTLTQASKIFPKTNTAVFVSKGYFGDNIKYAYLAFLEHAREWKIDLYYLTDDPRQLDLLRQADLPCIMVDPEAWSLRDARALLSAKVVVLGDNFHPYTFKSPKAFGMLQGAKSLQMWHGIPIKEIGLRYILRGDRVILDELLASAGEYDLFAAPAKLAREEWAQRFAFKDFAATGYPRNDVFFREPTELDLLNVDRNVLNQFETARRSGRTSIIYTPTYRDDKASNWFVKAGIDRFAAHCAAKDYELAVNPHPYEQGSVRDWQAQYPGIRFITPGTDIYPIVRQADMLITDYSSLAFDYLLLDRPLVFYRPAGDEVVVKSRGFIPDLLKETPGAVAANVTELMQAAENAAVFAHTPGSDPHTAPRHDLRAKLFDHVDGNAGRRVSEGILRMMRD